MNKNAYNFYNKDNPKHTGRDTLPQYERQLVDFAEEYNLNYEQILELGCGCGALSSIFQNYVGIDLSFPALLEAKNKTIGKLIQADIESVPMLNASIDLIFTFAVLEHIPNPENCMAEIDRVLKPGGIAIVAPAWFCRTWAADGLPVKSFSELNFYNKIRKATIPIRDNLLFRSLFVIPKRITREILYALKKRPVAFTYKRLKPNLEEYVYTDCDAFASMDPHMAIIYYRSRGYKILKHGSLVQRLFVRHEPVLIQKPK